MTILLELLKEVFPENELFPSSYRDAWKIVKDLGLSYHKIHACPNDCLIYWKETEHETFCRKCGTPRYKQIVKQSDDSSEQANKVPAKLVRYFPLKPRLQRLFMSSKTASLMRWHEEERIKDGKLRHPADSLAWKHFNDRHPSFASDPRNVRLGLAADGFNPFKAMNNKYSTWPVILVPYNLPSGMCMKQTSFMLCLLIDGPKAPGNDIHIYLQLVIDELNEFWDLGVPTYDAASKQMFYLRAALLWTINDFPAYGNLSGWSTKERNGDKKALHPQSKGDKVFLPTACFTMSKDEKEIFCNVLKTVKVPDGYTSNISRIIIELQDIFRQLYSKVLTIANCETLEDRTPLALCELEKMFPPPFFNIMEHLLVHLPKEAKLGGPFQFRSMYPIERNYEGEYLNRQIGRPLGKEEVIYLDDVSWVQAHRYVLGNLETVDPFRREHKHLLTLEKSHMSNYEMKKIHNETFYKWFKKHVEDLEKSNSCHDYYKEIAYLAAGPDIWTKSYSSYIVNGFHFHTKKREMRRQTQNSGVFVNASANNFVSTKDKNPMSGILEYYGVLVDIVELRYSNDIKFVMFKCDWVDNVTGMKQDEHNFTLVNFDHILYKQNTKNDEPFILASQAQQTWHDEHSAWQRVNNNNSEDSNVSWVREGVDGVILDAQTTKSKAHVAEVDDGFFSDEDNLGIGNTIDDISDDDDFFDKAQQGEKADN
ncbi:uncharacterized protein [Coffea arabica]|uniref:Transposase n=1 Tax=Coffea arabica TaxID=13443 RepID=A0ABM4WN95_COFAR